MEGNLEDSDAVDTFAALRELQSRVSADGFARICETFLVETPGLLAQVDASLAQGDVPGARRIAHKLKGGMATFGALALSRVAERMELAPTDDPEAMAGLARQLHTEFGRARAEVNALLQAGG